MTARDLIKILECCDLDKSVYIVFKSSIELGDDTVILKDIHSIGENDLAIIIE